MHKNRFSWQGRPIEYKENTVTGERYRFTVLPPSLIRMEYLLHSQICNNEKTVIFRKLKELAVVYDVMFNLSIRVGEASGLIGAFRELLTLTEP